MNSPAARRASIEVRLIRRLLEAYERNPAVAGVLPDTDEEAQALSSFVSRGRASQRGVETYLTQAQAHLATERLRTLKLL